VPTKPSVPFLGLLLALVAATAVAGADPAPIEYANKATPGPQIIVLPGEIKTTNTAFKQKFSSDNIADFAELELGNANFKVLERADLGELLKEFQTAYTLGDPDQAHKLLGKGRLKTTKWILRFDILKAEQTEARHGGFNGAVARDVAGSVLPSAGLFGGGSRAGAAAGAVGGSVATEQAGGTWTIGMRYKIIDATTTEQVAQGYKEDKVEVGASSTTVAGISTGKAKGLTLDSVVQRLVQESVADIDAQHK
jgi:hypothetical protein